MFGLIANPRVLILFAAMIVVTGLSAIQSLPRTEDPAMVMRFGMVFTHFPGASAERVEALVSETIENKLRTASEVRHVDSISTVGLSLITVQLHDEVTRELVPRVWAELRDDLEEVVSELPEGAAKPRLDIDRNEAYTYVLGMTLDSDVDQDVGELGRYAEALESKLRGVYGTAHVYLVGLPQEDILVDVDYDRALSLGIDINTISRALDAADAKLPAGQIINDTHRIAIEPRGGFESLERIRRIPLQGEEQGVVSLADIATVTRQPREPAELVALVNGERGVAVAVRMRADQRGDLWRDAIVEVVDQFAATLPSTVRIEELFDQKSYTMARLAQLISSVAIGFTLITVVLFFALGWRSALLVSLSLPLTILFALACMQFTGLPIHQMSMTGLIVALGIMVDNAIVMTDTVARYRRDGTPGLRAAAKAVRHLWLPLLGSTMTTVLTFMPIVLLPGNAGEFVGGIAWAVIFTLIGSYLISHVLVSGMAGRVLGDAEHSEHHWYQRGIHLPRLAGAFRFIVQSGLAAPRRTMALVFIVPLIGVVMARQLPEQFFPPSDRDMINFEVYLPLSSSLSATREVVGQIDKHLSEYPGIESRSWFIGGNAPSFYYNLMQRRDNAQYYAQAMLTMSDFREANRLVPVLQDHFDEALPHVQVIVRRLEQGPPFNAPVEIRLFGPDLDQLAFYGEQIKQRLLMTPHVAHSRTTLTDGVPKIWLSMDETILLSLGLTLSDAATQSRQLIDGVVPASLLETTESLPVRVRAQSYKTDSGAGLVDLPLHGHPEPEAAVFGTPLSALGRLEYAPERSAIARRDGERVNGIEAYLEDGVLASEVLQAFQQQLAANPVELPEGYRLEVGGESEKRSEAVGKLLGSFGLIIVLLVVALVMAFNSFRLSAIILAVAVQAGGLGMLALSLSGFPFGFTAIIGLMGLIGLAINAAIVIIAELRTDHRAMRGDAGAIFKGVQNCSRHISSTTITTVMGFLPLILGGGGFWPPFAIVVAMGTLFTTLLSFLFVPAAFLVMASRGSLVESNLE